MSTSKACYLLPLLLLLSFPARLAELKTLPNILPEPVTNNAVALIESGNQTQLFSFMGLGEQKTWQQVHNKAFEITLDEQAQSLTKTLPNVPSSLPLKGRLASIAASVNNRVFLFGGYTVAEDHSEISSPDNFEYIASQRRYRPIAPTPVPTDDAIALSYQNRYIYLISGWHNDGNVNLVQVYDIKTNSWQQASPFLGKPVFGHAGGISGNQMLVCDGVSVDAQPDKRRTFSQVQACYSGKINPDTPYKIDWRIVPHPTRTGRYRMASAGATLTVNKREQAGVLFIGGSDNPYNYNGIGYNGKPASPSKQVWFYGFASHQWYTGVLPAGTMDHRGLLIDKKNRFAYILGGMAEQQTVLASAQKIDLQALALMLTPVAATALQK